MSTNILDADFGSIEARVLAHYGDTLPPTRVWSAHQHDIFAAATTPKIIRAVAGSGKSTTVKEMVNYFEFGTNYLFLAFNKAIADELAKAGVNARTFHSLCYGPVLRALRQSKVEPDKIRHIVKERFQDHDQQRYGSFCARLVGLARNAGIGATRPDSEQEFYAIIEHHDLELEYDDAKMDRAVYLTRKVLDAANESPVVDFDDLLYRAVRDGIALPTFDHVIVDEGQDTNEIQRAVLRKISKVFTVVGDEAQAIYGFRGADSDSMNALQREFNLQPFPLTVTYRCAKSIVAYAQQFGEIQAAPNAPEGKVVEYGQMQHANYEDESRTKDNHFELSDLTPSDLVVCRTTAPLVKLAYRMLRAGKAAHVMGREIGQGLVSIIEKRNARGIDNLQIKLVEWAERETEKAKAKKNESKLATIADQLECIMFMIDELEEVERTIPGLCRKIRALFEDRANATTLATIHKSKGLEADRVFWLNYDRPVAWATQDWQLAQETNLCYVAATRAKTELHLIPTEVK